MSNPSRPVTSFELGTMRSNLKLLHHQITAGSVDRALMEKHITSAIQLLERIEAGQQSQVQVARLKALYDVSQSLGSSLDLQTVLDQVMDAIIRLTGAERGFLMLRDDDGGLTVKVARNLDQETLTDENFKYSRTVAHHVLDSGTPILTTNAAEDPRFAGQASIVAQALRSVMAAPLRARREVIGVVYVDSRATAGLFSDDDLDALKAFSGQAAVALDNALLFNATDTELAQRVEQLRQLRRIDLLLNETLDINKAMAYTLEWACRLSQASSGHLGLVEGDPPRIQTMHHYGLSEDGDSPGYLEAAYAHIPETIAGGKTITFAWAEADIPQVILITPIQREQRAAGVLILRHDTGEPFTDEQQDMVARIITRAAVSIENARLYAAVQAADRAKSEFVGVVAHDLKSPMTGIAGYAEMTLVYGNLSERERGYVQKIKDAVQRMEMLVSDLADISRIESGHFFMEETRVPVETVIQAVKDVCTPQITERGHTLVEDIAPNLPDMRVDYYRLVQVLTNLVSNAYKYTPNGGTITLTARRADHRVEFSVADTGIGLSETDLEKLGTKFWRAQDDYTRSQSGTGLGFSITRSLVEQMGSKVQIESKPGAGSKFTFSVISAGEA